MKTTSLNTTALGMIALAAVQPDIIHVEGKASINDIRVRIAHRNGAYTVSLARQDIPLTETEIELYKTAFHVPIAECETERDTVTANGELWHICRLTWQNCVPDAEAEQPFLVELPEQVEGVRYE